MVECSLVIYLCYQAWLRFFLEVDLSFWLCAQMEGLDLGHAGRLEHHPRQSSYNWGNLWQPVVVVAHTSLNL